MARHPAEKASVGQVLEKGFLLKATQSEEIAKIMRFDETTKGLSVEDPQLVFYLRNLDWANFVKRSGFTRVEVPEEYDFALSFAGEDRPFAEKLKDHLEDLRYSVFYDMSEQHRISRKTSRTSSARSTGRRPRTSSPFSGLSTGSVVGRSSSRSSSRSCSGRTG
jgi:hypothetical protein